MNIKWGEKVQYVCVLGSQIVTSADSSSTNTGAAER